ncbi:MAG TPA: DUF2079 domain-containing protein, partial [Streptosporangiaceae bacterium]|nr:DUF2079 domain-containing protein [Streptosporangiaceae bacterium]
GRMWPDGLRYGAVLVVWGIAWSVLEITVIIPHFNPGHHYPYWFDGGAIGSLHARPSPPSVAAQLGHAGGRKLATTAMILLPVAFLALGSPVSIVALPSLALRFLSTNSYFWGTQFHYNATVMPVVFIAAIDTLARLRTAARDGPPIGSLATAAGAASMVAIAAAAAFWFPLAGLWQGQTYTVSPHVRAQEAAMARVPPGTTVETTLGTLAPLAARDAAFWIGTWPNPAPQYVVFDESNSGWSPPPADVLTFVQQRHPGTSYRRIFLQSNVYVFRRS